MVETVRVPLVIDSPPPWVTIVGIGGALGSGTSTLAGLLKEQFGPERCVVIDADDYFLREDVHSLVHRLRGIRSSNASGAAPSDILVLVQGSVLLVTSLLHELLDVKVFIDVPSGVLAARMQVGDLDAHSSTLRRSVQSLGAAIEGDSDMYARSADIILDGLSLSALDSKVVWGAIRAASSRGTLG